MTSIPFGRVGQGPALTGDGAGEVYGSQGLTPVILRAMDARIRKALESERTIDITTTGRASGSPRRIEMWFHNLDGKVYITGTPGKRDWYANLLAHPEFRFHLKVGVVVDLAARARPIIDPAVRRAVLIRIVDRVGRTADLEAWLAESPLVEVTFEHD